MRIPTSAAVVYTVVLAAAPDASAQARSEAAALPRLARDVVCAPVSPAVAPAAAMKVVGSHGSSRTLMGVGERAVINAGTADGVRVGDEYVVRRTVADRHAVLGDGAPPLNVHTAGTVQIVDAGATSSVALLTLSCDGISTGDYLERFQAPSMPSAPAGTTPDFTSPARVILGAERRHSGGTRDFMVIDRGSDQGLRAGQVVTVFRGSADGASAPVAPIGTATVYLVQPGTSTIRIDSSVDAVYVGDLIAVHR